MWDSYLLTLRISVIIPVYRDRDELARTLGATDFGDAEVIIAAAEDDQSLSGLRGSRPDLGWVTASRGRARQMNAGAAIARGDWLRRTARHLSLIVRYFAGVHPERLV